MFHISLIQFVNLLLSFSFPYFFLFFFLLMRRQSGLGQELSLLFHSPPTPSSSSALLSFLYFFPSSTSSSSCLLLLLLRVSMFACMNEPLRMQMYGGVCLSMGLSLQARTALSDALHKWEDLLPGATYMYDP